MLKDVKFFNNIELNVVMCYSFLWGVSKTRKDLEYMSTGLSFNSYENCIKYLYKDKKEIEVRLLRKKDKDLAIEYAYDKGFKIIKTITLDEMKALLGLKVKLIQMEDACIKK